MCVVTVIEPRIAERRVNVSRRLVTASTLGGRPVSLSGLSSRYVPILLRLHMNESAATLARPMYRNKRFRR